MKLRTKILGGFMATVFVTMILGVTGFISARTLTATATELRALEVQNESITAVLNAHYAWRQNLVDTVLTGQEFKGSLDPDTCALGQWYNTDVAKNLDHSESIEMLRKLDEPHHQIHNEAKVTLELMYGGNAEEARQHLENVIFPKTAEVISILTGIQNINMKLVEEKGTESIRLGNLVQTISVVLTVVAICVALTFAFIITNMISKPLLPLSSFMHKAGTTGDITIREEDVEVIKNYSDRKDEIGHCISGAAAFVGQVTNIAKELEMIASGDLTTEVKVLSDDDQMGHSLKNMVGKLNQMFGDINSSSTQVAAGSKQVADGAQALAQGATEQAASIAELSCSINEIAKKTKDNAETAEKTARLAETIIVNAEKGSTQMDEMISAVHEINQASQDIGKVIKVIDDIAFQTNILALNAAVEAARAGQHGKGFAVVAEEVRNLASKSANAAKETSIMIENSIEKAELGTRIAGETAASLTAIVSSINESSGFIKEIAVASEEQAMNIDQINSGIDQVAMVVQQNSATAQESAAASEQMSSQSAMLEELIAQFRIKEKKRVSVLPTYSNNADYFITERAG